MNEKFDILGDFFTSFFFKEFWTSDERGGDGGFSLPWL